MNHLKPIYCAILLMISAQLALSQDENNRLQNPGIGFREHEMVLDTPTYIDLTRVKTIWVQFHESKKKLALLKSQALEVIKDSNNACEEFYLGARSLEDYHAFEDRVEETQELYNTEFDKISNLQSVLSIILTPLAEAKN